MERFSVTGSSSGIGKEIVKELLKRGLTVAGFDINVENNQVSLGKFYEANVTVPEGRDLMARFCLFCSAIRSLSLDTVTNILFSIKKKISSK